MIDEGRAVNVVHLGFSKALDKFPHDKLIQEVKSHGIHSKLRTESSSGREISSPRSVLPGSVLGTLLFVTYVNNLEENAAGLIRKVANDTKIGELRMKEREHAPIYINGTEAERVKSIKFLGVTITDGLHWTSHVNATVKKAQQCLFFLRRLRKFGMSMRPLTNFYRYTTESILSGCITAWYGNCSAQDRTKLQKVVCIAQIITEANLPSIDSIDMDRCCGKAANIIKDPSHP
eukprot:g41925.t1